MGIELLLETMPSFWDGIDSVLEFPASMASLAIPIWDEGLNPNPPLKPFKPGWIPSVWWISGGAGLEVNSIWEFNPLTASPDSSLQGRDDLFATYRLEPEGVGGGCGCGGVELFEDFWFSHNRDGRCANASFSPTHPGPNSTPTGKTLAIFLAAIFQTSCPRSAANRARLLA